MDIILSVCFFVKKRVLELCQHPGDINMVVFLFYLGIRRGCPIESIVLLRLLSLIRSLTLTL